jgi:hypothetical protein
MDVYEMQKVRQGGFGRRLGVLVWCLVLLCIFIAVANGPRDGGEEAALWVFAGVVIAFVGAILFTLRWLFTGR